MQVFLVLYDTYALVEAICGAEFRRGATNKTMVVMCDQLSLRIRQLVVGSLRFERQIKKYHGFLAPNGNSFNLPHSQFELDFIE